MKEFFWALAIIFQVEGGWTEIDGGTMYGIKASTLRSAYNLEIVNHHNIRQLTRIEAARIYYQMYWIPSGADRQPRPLNLAVFNAAVHMGVGTAGNILKHVQSKTSSTNPRYVASLYLVEQYNRMRKLKRFNEYGRGWQRRMLTIARHISTTRIPRSSIKHIRHSAAA